ncbi:D-glycerate dehydrogenase [Sphingorhabdus lutea]|uniref:D-glycerate dehydrogenase n=1 Tax=Sphingorhabdus lutea TaxID=1913578 RepID=A0A1L3JB52_9SPHN|nr:D-glycerate dehydrogenase [Sphingorhabdus lutea]APG62367.1 D-glycerate dehydrogenase [Sphingorhabdus lutea]
MTENVTNQSKARTKIVVSRKMLPSVEARMNILFDAALNDDDHVMTAEEIITACQDAQVFVPTVTDNVDAALINALPDNVRMIANFGAGVDHIDLAAAKARSIIVTNTPGVFTEDTADLTMALILAVPRRLGEGEKLMRSGQWQGWSPTGLLGHRIGGKTLGIIGFGRIGEAVARRARAMNMNIIYHKRKRLPASIEGEMGVTYEGDLKRLMANCDIISIHCPLTKQTENMIDAEHISLMKSGAYLINTSRGEIVDEQALITALQDNKIAGAGLDVYAHEPQLDQKLIALSNVIILPHLGSSTFEGREASGERVIANIRIWADGHRPPDQVLDGLV